VILLLIFSGKTVVRPAHTGGSGKRNRDYNSDSPEIQVELQRNENENPVLAYFGKRSKTAAVEETQTNVKHKGPIPWLMSAEAKQATLLLEQEQLEKKTNDKAAEVNEQELVTKYFKEMSRQRILMLEEESEKPVVSNHSSKLDIGDNTIITVGGNYIKLNQLKEEDIEMMTPEEYEEVYKLYMRKIDQYNASLLAPLESNNLNGNSFYRAMDVC